MKTKGLSIQERAAIRLRRALDVTRQALKEGATPMVRAPQLARTPGWSYGQRGSHEYAFFQPPIPGSWEWFRREFGRK